MKRTNSFFSIWPIYLLIIAVVAFSFSWAIDIRTNPSREETIDFCISINKMDESSFKDRIIKNINHETKLINIQKIFPNTSDYDYLYNAIEENVDLYILPLGKFVNNFEKYNRYFATLNVDNIVDNLGQNIDTFNYGDKVYGVKIYDEIKNIGLSSDIIHYETASIDMKDYYIFLNRYSVHSELTKSTSSFYDVIKSLYNEK